MPYLYQDSKPRPAAHPGAARATHSSGKGYEQLKQECLSRGVLFEDSDFPACNSSLFFSENPPIPFVWKRPGVSMPWRSLSRPAQNQAPLCFGDAPNTWSVPRDVEMKCGGKPFPSQEQWLRIGMPPAKSSSCRMRGLEASRHVPDVARSSDTLMHVYLWTCKKNSPSASLLHYCQRKDENKRPCRELRVKYIMIMF